MLGKSNIKYVITLAGLLHDIGVFSKLSLPNDERSIKELSLSFFNQFVAIRNCIAPIKKEVLSILSGYDNSFINSINLADKLDNAANIKDTIKKSDSNYLTSIFSKIKLEDPEISNENSLFVKKPMTLNADNIFPEVYNTDRVINPFNPFYELFLKEFSNLPDKNLEEYTDNMLFLFEKYLCNIPSSANCSATEISLYDHAKAVASLALCKELTDDKENPFLIIGADISGIQNFIYKQFINEAEEFKPAKILRGKSFYLSLLTDVFSAYLVKKFDVTRANILMNGGGHFVLIVPNNKSIRDSFPAEKKLIQEWLFKTFFGELQLILEFLQVSDDLYKDFALWNDKLNVLLHQSKNKKNFEIIDCLFDYEVERPKNMDYFNFLNKYEGKLDGKNKYEKFIISLNQMYQEIGKSIPHSKYLLEINTVKSGESKLEGVDFIPFTIFNILYVLVENKAKLKKLIENNNSANIEKITIFDIKPNVSKMDSLFENKENTFNFPVVFGLKLLGNYCKLGSDSEVMPFDKLSLQNIENGKDLGYGLLGILRMDVDNLGIIFRYGFKRDFNQNSIESLTRIITLSRELNVFFLGYINKLAKEWDIYIVYSGGDDLMVVGSWINVINFSLKLRSDFKKFACDNKNVNISAGLYLCKDSFPIGKAARLAGKNESEAKDGGKNSICVFNKVFKWDDFEELLNYGKELDKLIDKGNDNEEYIKNEEKIKSSYIHFLLDQINKIYETSGITDENMIKQTQLDNYFRNISKIKYSLARDPRKINAKAISDPGGNRKVLLLSKLINDKDQRKYLENFIVPASYILFKNRNLNN